MDEAEEPSTEGEEPDGEAAAEPPIESWDIEDGPRGRRAAVGGRGAYRMRRTPRGPGRAGGVLFLVVLLFVGYLLLNTTTGGVRVALGLLFAVVIGIIAGRVFRRG